MFTRARNFDKSSSISELTSRRTQYKLDLVRGDEDLGVRQIKVYDQLSFFHADVYWEFKVETLAIVGLECNTVGS